jgi:hypothetical protein
LAILAGAVVLLAGCGSSGGRADLASEVDGGAATSTTTPSTATTPTGVTPTTGIPGSEVRVPTGAEAPVLDPPGRPGGSGPLGPDRPELAGGAVADATSTTVTPLVVTGRFDDPPTATTVTTATTGDDGGSRAVDVGDLEVGMCFLDPGSSEVAELLVVPCAEPHVHEVVALWQDTSPAGAAFPGRGALLADADCMGKLTDYAGVDPLVAGLDALPITPEAATWADGDRAVGCYASRYDRTPRTGSLATP